MKICGRCDQTIKPGEEYTEYDIPSTSGAGITVYRHDDPCPAEPYQTAPLSGRR